ncbi:MAG: 6-bladed beta-propeller [Candidatus Delongbacteria bacterium]|nr:6-bladed beta-propeller [Candidatus Delongbacteria bacterium]MBN2833519.1 6-bladed beta-propeller [Candidatus Delongbacteria bacterium]
MRISYIIMMIILISCSNSEYKIENIDGYEVVTNNNIKKDIKINLNLLYEIKNSDNSIFSLKFPRDRFSLNSALDSSMNLFVVDNVDSKIMKFNNHGIFVKEFGGKGQGPGEFPASPVDLYIYKEKLYVIDENGRMTIFDLEGNFIEYRNNEVFSMRPRSLKVSDSTVFLTGEAWQGRWGTEEFKYGLAVFKCNIELTSGDMLYGDLKSFDIGKISPEFDDIYSTFNGNKLVIGANSKSEFKLFEYDKSGKKNREIIKKYNQIYREQESIDGMKKALEKYSDRSGGMFKFEEPSKYKNSTGQIFIGPEGSVFVSIDESQIDNDGQKFNVFNELGIMMGTAIVKDFANFDLRSDKGYLIAATSKVSNYAEEGKTDPVIKVYSMSF